VIAWNSGLGDAWARQERRARMELENRLLAKRLAATLARMEAEAAAFRETVARLHRCESQQAFRRPPKRCGRGRPPMRKWEARSR